MAEVYALIRESNNTVRYIGWTSNTTEKRFKEHLNCKAGKRKTPVYDWMRKYDDVMPITLCANLTDDEARAAEIELIARYGIENLLNISTGGEGSRGFKHTQEHLQKMSKRFKGKPLSEEHKRKISESNKGRKRKPLTDEQRAKLSASLTGRIVSEETRKKRSESLKGRTYSEETLAKMSAGQKKRFQNPEERKRYSEMFTGKGHTEETKRKMSETRLRLAAEKRANKLNEVTDAN